MLQVGAPQKEVSPPARGWSRAARNAAKPKRGFPARAGMVPM